MVLQTTQPDSEDGWRLHSRKASSNKDESFTGKTYQSLLVCVFLIFPNVNEVPMSYCKQSYLWMDKLLSVSPQAAFLNFSLGYLDLYSVAHECEWERR